MDAWRDPVARKRPWERTQNVRRCYPNQNSRERQLRVHEWVCTWNALMCSCLEFCSIMFMDKSTGQPRCPPESEHHGRTQASNSPKESTPAAPIIDIFRIWCFPASFLHSPVELVGPHGCTSKRMGMYPGMHCTPAFILSTRNPQLHPARHGTSLPANASECQRLRLQALAAAFHLLNERAGRLPKRVSDHVDGGLPLALFFLRQRDVGHLFAGIKQRVPSSGGGGGGGCGSSGGALGGF